MRIIPEGTIDGVESGEKTSRRGWWSLAGIVAGLTGIAVSYLVASILGVGASPVVAIAQSVIRLTPGPVAEFLIGLVGRHDKTLLVLGILVVTSAVFAWAGQLARRAWWAPALVFAALAAIAGLAVAAEPGVTLVAGLPVVVGFVTWVVVLSSLAERLERAERDRRVLSSYDVGSPADPAGHTGHGKPADRGDPGRAVAGLGADQSRRGFLIGAAVVAAIAAVAGIAGRLIGGGRRRVEESRRLLRLEGVSSPVVPESARVGLDGVSPWLTPVDEFYRIDTAVVVPVIEPDEWLLRIHGMVEREITISYAQLMEREITEGFTTICCVSNPVGGDLIGNAWWSGVRLADLLAEAGVSPDADAVLQTSDDGWSCSTPLTALTDDRQAILAVAMDGRPLPIEHGFPVRSIVPGLYGYVSATKWVVDMEVTRFDEVEAYWTQRGWGEKGPIKISSRVDVPSSGQDVAAGEVRVGGVAWAQHTGISAVEVAVDGGAWEPATIADAGVPDSWVQWAATVTVAAGDHLVSVRATDANGLVQDQTRRDVLPDGATGYDVRDFTAS